MDYAAKRYITVIPEIDLPGHMMAAISAYPYLSCKGEQWSLRTVWGVEDIVMCPGKEDMFRFLDDIFSEIVPLFPGKYFHIGGDECPKTSWKTALPVRSVFRQRACRLKESIRLRKDCRATLSSA